MQNWKSFSQNSVVECVMGKLLCACEVEGTCSLIIVGPNDWLCRVELEDAQKTAFMKWVTSLPHVGAILLADVAVFGARITFKKDDSGLLSAAAMAGADVRFKAASFARLAVPCPFRVLASMTPEEYRPTSFNWVHYLIVRVGAWTEESLQASTTTAKPKYGAKESYEKVRMRFQTDGLPTIIMYTTRVFTKAQILALEHQVVRAPQSPQRRLGELHSQHHRHSDCRHPPSLAGRSRTSVGCRDAIVLRRPDEVRLGWDPGHRSSSATRHGPSDFNDLRPVRRNRESQ